MDIYLVGGAVRDQLLKLPYQERDWVVVGATPDELLNLGYSLIGKDFPVFLHPQTKEEYALARTERKTGYGYKGFSVKFDPNITLEDDLARRDLTINAIAQTSDGSLIDPYGGQQDIDTRVLRHVSPAFREDPVRILRIARFAARFHYLGFTIAKSTLTLMQAMVASGEAQHLVSERIWKELSRALSGSNPEVFFQSLQDCGALQVIAPELFTAIATTSEPKKITASIKQMVYAVEQAGNLSQDPKARFTALFLPFTSNTNKEQHKAHLASIKQLCTRIAAPKDYTELALFIGELYQTSRTATKASPPKILSVLKKTDAFRRPERFSDFLLCCKVCIACETCDDATLYNQHQKSLEFLQAVYQLCSEIDIQEIIAQGFQHAAISQELERRMLATIKQYTNEQGRQ